MGLEMSGPPSPPSTGHEGGGYAFRHLPNPYKDLQGSEGVKIQYAQTDTNLYSIRRFSGKSLDSYVNASNLSSDPQEFNKSRTSNRAAYTVPKTRIVNELKGNKPYKLN